MKKVFLRFLFLSLFLAGGLYSFGQSPCLSNWQYTRQISVRNFVFGLLNDWQVSVSVNTQALIAAGKMNPDGSDIRFTTNDCCTQLPYWIQSGLNTPNTIIWTRVPQLASRDTTWLQMYYGNPSATTVQSNIDLVHFSMGNDSMGTAPAQAGITAATQSYVFPFNARTVRFRVYHADTMRIKFKVTNDTNMVTGTSPFFNAPNTPGFHNFDHGMVASAGGHIGWYSSTGGNFLNTCTPVTPCPGSCGDVTYGPGDKVVFGALDNDTCGVVPSMKVWFRRSAFTDTQCSSNWPEFNRFQSFAVATPQGNIMCFSDSLPLYLPNIGAATYQWYRNGDLIVGANDTSYVAHIPGSFHCVADFGVACQVIISDTSSIAYLLPAVDLGPDVSVCSDTGYTIDAGAGFASYTWSDNSTNQTLHVTNSGTYSVSVTDTLGCIDTDTIVVTLHPLPVPTITASGPTSICSGSTVPLTAYSPGWFAYEWLPNGETSANIDVTSGNTYSVIVYDQFFCSDTSASITVTVFPDPVLELGPPVDKCVGDSAVLDAGTGWSNILWPDFSNNQTLTVFATGFYRAQVTDSNGCMTDDTAAVTMHLPPTVDIGPSDTLCPTGTMTLDAGSGFASYAWTNGATSQTVSVGPGIYNVAVLDSNGCSGSSNIVYLTSYPSLATPTVSGNATLLTASTAPNYQWYYNGAPISGANSGTYVPTLSGTYAVGVTDPYHCADAMSANIEVILDITADDIPEGFSPNGDGINDRFEIQNINQFAGNSLVVMNRWGQKVFSQAPYSNTFNGKGLGGEDLPDGTYFYILDLGTGKVFNDYLIINR